MRKILIISGSPRGEKSTTHQAAKFIYKAIGEGELGNDLIILKNSMNDLNSYLPEFASAEILFFLFPLYGDSLPYEMMYLLEFLHDKMDKSGAPGKKQVYALCQSGLCGHHNKIALDIIRNFAEDSGFFYAAGFPVGRGGIMNGHNLNELSRYTKNLRGGLIEFADAVKQGTEPAEKTIKKITRPSIPLPAWLYKILANMVMRESYKKRSFSKGVNIVLKRFAAIVS